MARFKQGNVLLKAGQAVRFDDQDVDDASADVTEDTPTTIILSDAIQDISRKSNVFGPAESSLMSTVGIKGQLGIENIEFAEEASFTTTETDASFIVEGLPNGNIATITRKSTSKWSLEIFTPAGVQVNTPLEVTDTAGSVRAAVLQTGHIVISCFDSPTGRFRVVTQDGDLAFGEVVPETADGNFLGNYPNIIALAGGRFMIFGNQGGVKMRMAIYEIEGSTLSTIVQLRDVEETSGITNVNEGVLLADGKVVLCGWNSIIAGEALVIIDQNGQEIIPAVSAGTTGTVYPLALASRRIMTLQIVSSKPWLYLYDYELNLVDSSQLSATNLNLPAHMSILNDGKVMVGWTGDAGTDTNYVEIIDENLNVTQSITLDSDLTTAEMASSPMYTGGFVLTQYTLGSAANTVSVYRVSKTKVNGSLGLESGVYVSDISTDSDANDSTSVMVTAAIQSRVEAAEATAAQLIADEAHPSFLSTPTEIVLQSTKGIKGLLGVENTEFTEENSFEITGLGAAISIRALPNGNIATLLQDTGDNSVLEIHTPDGTQVAIYTVLAAVSDASPRLEVLQNGHIIVSYMSGISRGNFVVFNQDGELLVAETTPVTSEGAYVTTPYAMIQPLAGGKFMFYGHQYNVVARIAIYEMVGGSLTTIKQLFDVTETSGATNIEESDLLADGNIAFVGVNSVIVGTAMMIVDQSGVEILQAVELPGVDSTDLKIKNLPSKRIAVFVKMTNDPWILIYDYELNLINSLQLSVDYPNSPYSIEVLQNGSIAIAWGDQGTKQTLVYILDENLNIEQTIVVSSSTNTVVYINISAMYTGGFVALDYITPAANTVRIFTTSKTRINGSLGLATGEYVNEISNNPASDSTTALMTTEAIQALVALPSGSAEFSVVDSDTAVAIADGKKAFTVSAALNGLNLTAKVASVHSLGGDATGSIVIQIRRHRAGADANMLSAPMVIGEDEYFATDGTIDAANDDLLTGDQIYIDIDDIPGWGSPANGLSVTLTFE